MSARPTRYREPKGFFATSSMDRALAHVESALGVSPHATPIGAIEIHAANRITRPRGAATTRTIIDELLASTSP